MQAICIFDKFAKILKNMNKKVNFGISKLFISLIVLSTLISSCVQGDLYELYDKEDLVLGEFTKKTKPWSDPLLSEQGTHNGKAHFYGTECAAFALSYYLSGGQLEGSIDNSVKLQAIKALMNWNYNDDSFAYNPDLNNTYKTLILDDGMGASTQNRMIPAIKKLFNKVYVAATNSTGYLTTMLPNIDEDGNVSGMYFIVTEHHVSVPYFYNRNTLTFTCYDCDGDDFNARVINDIKFVLLEDPNSNNQ